MPTSTAATFSADLLAALTSTAHLNEDEITRLNQIYNAVAARSGQFPAADTLTADDAPWVRCIELALTQGLDLQALRELVAEQDQQQQVNIWRQSLDPMSSWMEDTGGYGIVTQDALDAHCRHIRWAVAEDIDTPFTEHPEVLDAIVSILAEKLQVVLSHRQGVGPKTDLAFAQGGTIAMVSGLGRKALRTVAREMAKTVPAWNALNTSDTVFIIKTIIAAHRHSGYPASWLRLPWQVVGLLINGRAPWTYPSVLRTVTHILGHARVVMVNRSLPRLLLAYDGTYGQVDIDPTSLHLPLIQQGKKVVDAILAVLKISIKVGLVPNHSTRAALLAVHLHHLIEVKNATESGLYLASPTVKFNQDNSPVDAILSSRIQVAGIVAIDPVTGIVNQHAVVRGSAVMCFDWSPSASTPGEQSKFAAALPAQVASIDPATILMGAVHNVDYLGFERGYWALLNAVLLINYLRHTGNLTGPIAGVVGVEKPLITMLANEATAEGATNQGKTTFGRAVGGVLAPGIITVVFNRNPGAPSARMTVDAIGKSGTVLWDEFLLPDNLDHALGKEALQGVATGGSLAIGRVRENAPALIPRYSLILSVKIANWPPDLLNRALCTFFNPVTAKNACSPDELRDLMSGKVALTARLSMLRWIENEHLVERISALSLSTTWRFNGIAAVAEMLAGDAKDEVRGYLKAAESRAIQLRQQADVSTLAADLGFDQKFSLAALMDQRTQVDLIALAKHSTDMGGLRIADVVLLLYTGFGASSANIKDPQAQLTREYKTTFNAICAMAGRQLAQRPIDMHGFRLRRSMRKNSHGEQVPYVVVEAVPKIE